MQTYRTYAKEVIYDFRTIDSSFANKPRGGLWGCRGDEWYIWANSEEFPCANTYFEWELKEGSKIYTIENANDFVYLLKNFPHDISYTGAYVDVAVDSIDYMKLWKAGYDAVELTEEANNKLHFGLREGIDEIKNMATLQLMHSAKFTTAMLLGLNTWDVPSICVFDPRETVLITSRLKLQFTHKEVDEFSEVITKGGMPYVRN